MTTPASKQPEIVDNGGRYGHADALRYLATNYPRPLAVATGYVNLGGLREVADLDGPSDRAVRLLLGAAPMPGFGDDATVEETLEAGKVFDETLRRLIAQRNFDAFPPSRRLEALQRVDEFLASDRVQVRRYLERFLHGKAYLFTASPALDQGAPSAALVTSANLTAAGMYANKELGMVQYQPNVVAQAIGWFDELWEHPQTQDYKDALRRLLFPEVPEYTPQQIFLRMLLEYYGDEIEDVAIVSDRLARFQRDGYQRALRIVKTHGGVLYADGVGTGKTHVGLEFINEYARRQGLHVLVISPAQLRDRNWRKALVEANLPGEVISFQELAMDEQLARNDAKQTKRVLQMDKEVYRLVIIDEAHAFRSPDTTYYHALNRLLGGTPKDLVLLTATPVNNALWDLYHQMMLFARHDAHFADAPLEIADLRKFFRDGGANDPESISAEVLFPLIDAVTVRRDRRFLEKHYANDHFADGTPVRFPTPRLIQRRYDLDAAFPGAFYRIRDAIGALKMARYQPDSYRIGGSQTAGNQQALAGLIQSGLLKRFESSLSAALVTVTRMLGMQDAVISACEHMGAVPSPASLRDLYTEVREGEVLPETVEAILEGDEEAIPLEDLAEHYLDDLRHDRVLLAEMREDLEALAAQPDPKMEALREILASTPARKVAIFTGFGDTARYIEDQLKDDPEARGGREMTTVIGDSLDSDERQAQIERFAPKSVTGDDAATARGGEVDLLLATDVISEGQNLQQAQAVISFDMPWNPQRVVQRNGRVIRLLSPHDEVYLYTMLPEQGELDSILGLEAKLTAKIRAANAAVGMESPVLAEVATEERTFADLKEYAGRLAGGDATLLDEGEGAATGMFSGEEYRQLLSRAEREGRRTQLEEMPWGVGATFTAHLATPEVVLPAVVFAARDRRGKRHWRAVTRDGNVLDRDLEMLRLADPAEQPRAPFPDSLDLEAAWQAAAADICAQHNALLDPLSRAVTLPLSQRWAADLFLDPSLPQRNDFERAYEALRVPRDQAVLRALSAVRRDVNEGRLKPLDAAEEIARIVLDIYGLQPAKVEVEQPYAITPDDLGVVAYQLVLQSAD